MSWCRWGSRCTSSIPGYAVDELCEDCPGSSLYVYESVNGFIVCCSCHFDERGDEDGSPRDYEAETEQQMLRHLIEHHKNGQHVRRSLLWVAVFGTSPEPTSDWKVLLDRVRGMMRA